MQRCCPRVSILVARKWSCWHHSSNDDTNVLKLLPEGVRRFLLMRSSRSRPTDLYCLRLVARQTACVQGVTATYSLLIRYIKWRRRILTRRLPEAERPRHVLRCRKNACTRKRFQNSSQWRVRMHTFFIVTLCIKPQGCNDLRMF